MGKMWFMAPNFLKEKLFGFFTSVNFERGNISRSEVVTKRDRRFSTSLVRLKKCPLGNECFRAGGPKKKKKRKNPFCSLKKKYGKNKKSRDVALVNKSNKGQKRSLSPGDGWIRRASDRMFVLSSTRCKSVTEILLQIARSSVTLLLLITDYGGHSQLRKENGTNYHQFH